MRSDFFQQKPTDVQNASDRLVEKMDVSNMFYDAADGTKVFRVCFDVGQFSPEEIEVKTQDQRLTVHAVHYQKGIYHYYYYYYYYHHYYYEPTVVTSDKGGGKCVCPRLSIYPSVCLLARLLKNAVWIWMKCCVSTDVGTWTN